MSSVIAVRFRTTPIMTTQLLDAVKRFLPALEESQQQLADHFTEKSAAMKSARAPDLLRLAEIERTLVARLQERLAERAGILQRARELGLPAESLEHMVRSIAGDDLPQLRARMNRVRDNAALLRRESWIHWIVSHRTCSHYSDLLEIITHKGKTAPTYEEQPRTHSTGGAILDTSI